MLVSWLRKFRRRRGQFSLGGVKGGCCCGGTPPKCGVCSGAPSRLTFSYTYGAGSLGSGCADQSFSIPLTFDGVSKWTGSMTMPSCAACSCFQQAAPLAVDLACAGGEYFLQWVDFPSRQINGFGASGTFTCSPFFYTCNQTNTPGLCATPGACSPTVGGTGGCFCITSFTISA